MINTYQIYEQLSQSLGDESARKIASILGTMYEELQNTVTKVEFGELKGVVQELAEAQKRTEKRLEELVEAQKRTEEAVFHLSKRLDNTKPQLGGLSATVGYTLENESYRYLPALLEREHGLVVEGHLYRDYLTDEKGRDVEINILGRGQKEGQQVLILGESKVQLSRKHVDSFLRTRVRSVSTTGLSVFPLMVCHMVTQKDVRAYAESKGVTVYLSYQFQEQ